MWPSPTSDHLTVLTQGLNILIPWPCRYLCGYGAQKIKSSSLWSPLAAPYRKGNKISEWAVEFCRPSPESRQNKSTCLQPARVSSRMEVLASAHWQYEAATHCVKPLVCLSQYCFLRLAAAGWVLRLRSFAAPPTWQRLAENARGWSLVLGPIPKSVLSALV